MKEAFYYSRQASWYNLAQQLIYQRSSINKRSSIMDKSGIKDRVIKVTAQVMKMEPKEISPDANFAFDLGADSMQSVALIAGFEEEFNIEMDEDKAREVQTVNGAVEFISEYVQ
jgi:acyl carrier protein